MPESLLTALLDSRLSIMLIGPIGRLLQSRYTITLNDSYRITAVRDHRELSLVRHSDCFKLAVISDTIGRTELIEAARLVREQWPSARILVLGHAAVVLEDYLYDDVLPHSCREQEVLDALARMSTQRTHARPFIVSGTM